MEIVYILVILLLAGTVFYLLWKNRCLKQDIYSFTGKLELSLKEILNGKILNKAVYEQDDLWGKVYDRLCRISDMYMHRNQELYEEKENLKELVSDISHQTKTPLANIKLYQELLSDETDVSEGAEYLTRMGKQVDKLEFLLQSMVKISRLETGTIRIVKSEYPISETLALAIGAVVPKADRKKFGFMLYMMKHSDWSMTKNGQQRQFLMSWTMRSNIRTKMEISIFLCSGKRSLQRSVLRIPGKGFLWKGRGQSLIGFIVSRKSMIQRASVSAYIWHERSYLCKMAILRWNQKQEKEVPFIFVCQIKTCGKITIL